MTEAAKEFQLDIPNDYATAFSDESEPTEPTTALLVSIADSVSASYAPELVKLAKDFADGKHVAGKDTDKVISIRESFQLWVVPIRTPASLVDIVNAGWECNMNEHLWEDVPQIKGKKPDDFLKNRDRTLRDIMLKSMEISEIYERLGKP